MSVDVRPVAGRRDLRRFIELPYRLHASSPLWVPPLRIERRMFLSRERNPFFSHGDAQLFLAWRDGEVVGRISAHRNDAFDAVHTDEPSTTMFGFLEAEDDADVFAALIDAAAEWGRAQGRDRLLGPMDFAMNDECGVLIDGFDREPLVHQPWHPPYYQQHVEALGLAKAMDLLMWELDVKDRGGIHPAIEEMAAQARPKHGVVLRKMTRRTLRRDMDRFAEVYNAAWRQNWDYVPYGKADLDHLAQDMQLALNSDWFMVAEGPRGETVGVAITIPDLNQVLVKMNGRLLPFGWLYFLRRKSTINRVRVGWLGVLPEYLHTGAAALMFIEHFDMAAKGRITGGEMGWILENNIPMNRGMEAMGGRIVKRYRMYERPLIPVASAPS